MHETMNIAFTSTAGQHKGDTDIVQIRIVIVVLLKKCYIKITVCIV